MRLIAHRMHIAYPMHIAHPIHIAHPMHRKLAMAALLIAGLNVCAHARADDTAAATAPAPSRHQLMKDCMAKQKASEAGRTKEDMKKDCRDVTKTEKQNSDAEKKAEDKPAP